jgi:hypothetical protein
MQNLIEVKQVLEKIQFTKVHHKEQTQKQQTMQEQDMSVQSEEDTVQITIVPSEKFSITKDMLQMDEDMA